MDTPIEGGAPAFGSAAREFSVIRQKVSFDVDLLNQSVKGYTEITIAPQTKALRQIRLNCRQCEILSVTVEDKPASLQYIDPYKVVAPHPGWDIRQHHLFKQRLEPYHGDTAREELIIEMPKRVTVREAAAPPAGNNQEGGANRFRQSIGMTPGAVPDTPIASGAELQTEYQTLPVKISFALKDVRDGLHFVGLSEGDHRYPSVYTLNSSYPGTACCLFPCLDDPTERCEWEITVKCAKTLGGALGLSNAGLAANEEDVDMDRAEVENNFGLSEQERAMDLTVICSGQLEDEADDPEDATRKVVTYSTRDIYCSANQVGFALGPFEQVDVSDLREIDEDDKLADDAVQVVAYCLPGRAAEVKNTILPLAKAVDFFTERYTRYFYSSYQMCFLDDLPQDSVTTAGLSFLSTRLLFPEDIIDPVYETTHKVVHALAAQYSGIGVTAREPSDNWCIIGMAYFMTDMFMKSLCGNNEYRFRQKLAVDRIFELDRDRPSLYSLGSLLHLDGSEYDFVALKAAVVLFILDRRLTKSSTSSGVSRIINRTLTNSKGGDAEATLLSSAQFQKTCERTGHAKLDTFFTQWVHGAGCPNFKVSQRFNKKKLVVEMTIDQLQIPSKDKPISEAQELNPDHFLRDVNEELNEVWANSSGLFTGPMTIRIHEADGTPYEHIIDIKEAHQKLEIPYNTKYKRLKRNRRGQKDQGKAANAANQDAAGEDKDEHLLYSLGDVLQSEADVKDWQLAEWAPDQEKAMSEDSYEWIRMDADFEWICKMELTMPPWMHVSQLQQDRDVVAQYESLQYMGRQTAHPLISTFLTRTIMDKRYFHGIRTHAICLLPKTATAEIGWIGLTHLRKIYSELFCAPGTSQARANDFSDRAMYLVQCELPKAMARVRDNAGQVPRSVKRLFVDALKFNDNSQNEFSDCFWVSTLMSCLADVLVKSPNHPPTTLPYDEQIEEESFQKDAISEIERYRRIDEWISSYQNIYSRTALDCLLRISKSDIFQPKLADFLQYTKQGNADQLRLQAFRCLVDLGKLKHGPIARYMLHSIANDPSPYMREQVFRVLGRGLGLVAMGEDQPAKPAANVTEGLIIEEGSTDERAQDKARKTTIEGAIKALKAELSGNQAFADSLWDAVTSETPTLREIWQLLSIPEIIYDTKNELIVRLKLPRYWSFHHQGDGKCIFKQDGRVREKKSKPAVVPPPLPSLTKVDKPAPSRKPSVKLTLGPRTPSISIESAPPPNNAPSPGQAASLLQSMGPPPQRPTPAYEKPPVKAEGSPEIDRKPSIVATKRSKIVKLMVPRLKDSNVQADLARLDAKRVAAAQSAPRMLKLNTGGSIKKEPSSPNALAVMSTSPPPLQPSQIGTTPDQRRPSTASSGSSKRGQKRKSSDRETPLHHTDQPDYFTGANGNLAGEPQTKKSKTSDKRGGSKSKSATPAPTASFAPIATPTSASQQFGAWDTPTQSQMNGDTSAQFGAWDSGEKQDRDVDGRRTESPLTPRTPAPRPSRIVKLKLPSHLLAKVETKASSGSQAQFGPIESSAASTFAQPASTAGASFGPIENSTAGATFGPIENGTAGANFGPIENGTASPNTQPLYQSIEGGTVNSEANSVAKASGVQSNVNGGDVVMSDDDDDMPMARLPRANGNTETAKPVDSKE